MRPQHIVSVFRRLAPASMLLLALSTGAGPAAGQPALEPVDPTPVDPMPLAELAAAAPSGYELQEVSISRARGTDEVVTAEYLGPGVRNEISYTTFASVEAAEEFLRNQPADTCTVRTTAACLDRVREIVVTAKSSSTCTQPTPDVKHRALTLLAFGTGRLQSPSGTP